MSGVAYREEPPGAPAAQALPRLLAGARMDGRPVSLDAHLRRYGPPPALQPRTLVDAVAAAGLRGCGGAGFPTARKLEAVAAGRGRAVVVANGAEGEPPSGKDKVLLAYLPHLVLDGAVLAAHAVGARDAIVAVDRVTHDVVAYAIAERKRAHLDRGVSLRVVRSPEGFVTGEETALVQFLNGGPALPTFTPPRPFERGVGGAPTLVQNVETFAHLAQIARFGAEWFRAIGAGGERGSALVTLSGAVARPGVFEVAVGTPLRDVVAQAGGVTAELGAVLVGGYFGTWLPAAQALAAPLSQAGLAPLGGAPGARAIVALPVSSCGLLETTRVVRWLAAESAGQCGPCVHGLEAIAGDLVRIARRDDPTGARAALDRRLPQLERRGACRHPDGVVRLVASALRVFAAEVELHVHHRRCSSRADRAVLPLPPRRPEAVR
ncbi:MAG TPA: NADH-ubiquinone oxidoreductase-F iron-sulfur binding region domain-containing protein [Gaiellaceae bacterium]|nr:NADH-ubiquinone oxidoreductase-F iron-sulfur binding region domain-containing protein [Gaiellaceae bacterium]